jgi:hypothetical protein
MKVNICDTSLLCRNQQSHKEFRKSIKDWLKTNYLNTSFTNIETGFEIFINNTCMEKITNSFGDIKAHSFTAIPDIIKNEIFIESEDDKKERPDFVKILRFESLISVDKEIYEIWIYVRKTNTQNLLYSLNISVQKSLKADNVVRH